MSHASDKDYRVFGLDALRALAIVMVLAAHTWPSKAGARYAGSLAVLGVELFFVLSGFLIGGILIRLAETQRLSTLRGVFGFWIRRWFRTLPNYYFFLTLHLAWRTWILGFPDQVATNWEYFFFVQNFRYPPGFFFPETWSLAIEEWFYLLFALALFVGLRLLRKRWHTWLIVVGLFLAIPTLLRLYTGLQATPPTDAGALEAGRRIWDSAVRKIVIMRLDVVMYGVLGALIARQRPETWRRMAALWPLGVAFVGVAAASLVWHTPLESGQPWQGFVLWPLISVGFALLLPVCSRMRGSRGYAGRSISWVARVSYAVYLCHGLVLLGVARWLGNKSAFPLPRHTVLWCVVVWVLTFVIAELVYRWFEKPAMDLRERFGQATAARAPATPVLVREPQEQTPQTS